MIERSGIDECGAIRLRSTALVLLSGGLDSTACLHWALHHYAQVRAIGFDYGQLHRDAELVAAGKLAARRSVPFEMLCLADALRGGMLEGVPEHGATTGIHRAFVPGRNLVFLALAVGRACGYWPHDEDLTLVIGACAEDAAGFPDCTQRFLREAEAALGVAVARRVHVAAPYVKMSKVDMLADVTARFRASAEDLQVSWSCYAGHGPCGTCTPCVLRRDAFAAAGIEDLCAAPTMHGGDVGRDAALRGR